MSTEFIIGTIIGVKGHRDRYYDPMQRIGK